MVELKVNKNLEFNDMRLCRGTYERGENKTYVLLYADGENINAFVVTSVGDKIKRADKIADLSRAGIAALYFEPYSHQRKRNHY